MNGAHDLGGMHGFGPVDAEPDEPVFHSDWERRAFGLTLAMGAWRRWNLDMSRFAREQMPPAEYLATTYYEHWLFGLERLLVQHSFVTPDELVRAQGDARAPEASRPAAAAEARPAAAPEARPAAAPEARPAAAVRDGALRVDAVPRMLQNRRAARLDNPVPPHFHVGQSVRARNMHPLGHTRLPRYARGRQGVVAIDHGVFIFPDTHAVGAGTKPQHVYSVRFTARELWGPDASPHDRIYIDLWDDYLEAP